MPRKSLRPHLNQIRTWVRQGRTDAWIAHQLDVSAPEIAQFKRQNDLMSDEELAEGTPPADYEEEVDLRAEDDALIDLLLVVGGDRKSTRLNSSHPSISYAVFCSKKKTDERSE